MGCSGYVRGRFESIPGNETNSPTYSTKVLYDPATSFNIGVNPTHLERDDELRDQCEPLQLVPERYAPEWSREGRMYPDLLGFYLTAMLGFPTTTAGDAVITDPDSNTIPAGAHRHVWTAPFGPAGANPHTCMFDVAYDNESVYFEVDGAGCSSIAIETPEEGGATLSASGPALHIPATVADPTLTPTYESLAVPPFQHSHLSLPTFLAGSGTASTVSLSLESPMDPRHSLSVASKYPDQLFKGDGPIVVSGSVPFEQIDATDFDAMLAATGFGAKIRWESTAIIASAYPYRFWCEMDNAQYTGGGPEAMVNRRRLGADFEFRATYDGAGASTTFTLVNATSDYT